MLLNRPQLPSTNHHHPVFFTTTTTSTTLTYTGQHLSAAAASGAVASGGRGGRRCRSAAAIVAAAAADTGDGDSGVAVDAHKPLSHWRRLDIDNGGKFEFSPVESCTSGSGPDILVRGVTGGGRGD